MSEMKCSLCSTSLDFKSVLTSSNPIAIKCPGCDKKIKVKVSYAIPIAVVTVFLAVGLWYLLEQYGASFKRSAIGLIIFGLAVEYLYFEALRRGIVPSSLTNENRQNEEPESVGLKTYNIVPRIKNINYLNSVKNVTNGVENSTPITEPLVGDLVLAYAIDIGENYVALSKSSSEEFNISMENVRKTAETNALQSLRSIQVNPYGKLFEITCPDNMMACSILFPALWNQIEGEIDGPVIVAIPHRDTVIYARADDNEAIEELRDAMTHFDFEDTHALSKQFFVRDGNEWQKFDA